MSSTPRYLRVFSALLVLFLAGAVTISYGQGRGKGNGGGGKGHGGGGKQHGGERPGRGQGNVPKQWGGGQMIQRGNGHGGGRARAENRVQIQQPRVDRRAEMQKMQAQRQVQWQQQAQAQRQMHWQQQRGNARVQQHQQARQQQVQRREQFRQGMPQTRQQWQGWPMSDRGRGKKAWDKQAKAERKEYRKAERNFFEERRGPGPDRRQAQSVYDGRRGRAERQWRQPRIGNGWAGIFGNQDYRNYGQYRSAQVHERNALRKAQRQSQFGDRNYYYSAPQYYPPQSYGYMYSAPDQNWEYVRENILRSVIANAFRDDYGHVPSYTQVVSYVDPYDGGYQQPYYSLYDPGYGYQQPYYGSYGDPYYGGSPLFGADQYYGGDDRNAEIISMIGSIAEPLLNDSSAGNFVSRLLGGFLANGYDEGYQAAINARSSGYADDGAYYDPYDPYVYDNVSFDTIDYNPYSCLGESRRYQSEGYEIGYQDGLRDGSQQQLAYNDNGGGAVDLVSVLLGNIL